MFKKKVSQTPVAGSANKAHLSLSRRNFLRGAMAGVGVLTLPAFEACQVLAAPPQQQGSGSGQAQAIDPKTAQESWLEPWEWRTGDWPGEQVALNVVPHAAPLAIVGNTTDAALSAKLFPYSYNGSSPGPTIRVSGDEVLFLKLRNMLAANTDPCKPQHTAGIHQRNTTNLHVHGLHVQPTRNVDGSHSDNVLLRVMPRGDYPLRQDNQAPACWPLDNDEVVGEADYQFQLGRSTPKVATHPPGTFWYHPHPHGATYNQVACGMVGFLLIEGDVDDALKAQINPYKERLVAIQQIQPPQPLGSTLNNQHGQTYNVVNGQAATAQRVIVMQPGAIERWRVLNGNVDGHGYIQFMVLDAQNNPQDLYLLAVDGVTLVRMNQTTNTPEHYIKKLDKDKLMVMAPANRADFLFQAPALTGPDPQVYTIIARPYAPAVDAGGSKTDIVIATVIVRNDPAAEPITEVDPETITLPPVPAALYPIGDEELIIPEAEAEANGNPAIANKLRTRQVLYSGWGKAPNVGNTMAIDCSDFDPTNARHTMVLDTAEEWVVWNCSTTVSGNNGHSAVDHPMHIHINPFWIMAVYNGQGQQMDLNGNTADSPLYDFEPRWQDTIRLPRNGGRVIFRSRFLDFTGQFVHHCHILLHEDNGMMQMIQVVANARLANYVAKDPGYQTEAGFTISTDECNKINALDPVTCETVLARLRQPAS